MNDGMKQSVPPVPPLRTIYMYTSGACNLNCSHCWIDPEFHSKESGKGLHMSIDLVREAIVQGKPLGLSSVKLTGGEPLMNPGIREIIGLMEENGVSITIETNGTLVTREFAGLLAATRGFSCISVSMDGADAQTHDRLRRVEGAFGRAVDGVRNLVAAGIRPQLICTLHRNNVSQVRDVVKLGEALGCGSVKFNHVQCTGRGKDFDRGLSLTVPEIIELDRFIENEIVPASGIRVLPDIPFAFQKPARFLRSSPGRCDIHHIIGLLANGDLALCGIGTSVEELKYGNLYNDGLAHIWKNSPKLAELRRLIPEELEGVCSKCIHKAFCKGMCVAGNYSTRGRLNAPYHFCDTAERLGLFPVARMSILGNEGGRRG